MKKILLPFVFIIILSSCVKTVYMKYSNMDALRLGMTQNQVTQILGKGYTISGKKIENDKELTEISYRDSISPDEIYVFYFEDDKLLKWDREIVQRYLKAE